MIGIMATFILVHGTFARNAAWTRPDSQFCCRLRRVVVERGQSAEFVQIEWRGRNLGRDRAEAARAILREIERAKRERAGAPIFVIGHSHGGSAIAYFLKNFPDKRDAMTACAFLSTPFVALRIRPLWEELLTALVTAFGALVFLLGAAVASYIVYKQNWQELTMPLLVLAACFVPGVGTAAWVWMRAAADIKDELRKLLLGRIARDDTADIPVADHLFLRASGDEAAAALGTSQFVAWGMGKIADIAGVHLLRVRALFARVGASAAGLITLIVFAFLFAFWLLYLFATRLGTGMWHFLVAMFETTWSLDSLGFGLVGTAVEFAMRGLWPVFIFLFFGFAIYSIILITTIALGSLTLRMFGWMSILEAIFIDFSVEPVPYGEGDFVHIDWKEQSADATGLSHSRTYLNPGALDRLETWVMRRLSAIR